MTPGNEHSLSYDTLIVGGGMVGATLAHALGAVGQRVAVIEAYAPEAEIQPGYDDRAIAMAWGTRLVLQGLGLWDSVSEYSEPIVRIHVSDRGHFGFARLDRQDEGVEALGYVITGKSLGHCLLHGLVDHSNVDLVCPARLESFDIHDDRVVARVNTGSGERTLQGKLLVAADGGNSLVREQLAIGVKEHVYGQTAIVSNITPEVAHKGVAYERFTDTGPLALLPMTGDRCGLVWTVDDDAVDPMLEWDDTTFLGHLQERFGYRLGRLGRVGERLSFPLKLLQAREHVRPRVALIGNAAHTLHPVAGQGFNLGIRDAAVLAEVIADAVASDVDPGSREVLQRYADWRRQDQTTVARLTDGLVRLFVNPFGPIKFARNLGLLAVDCVPGAKHLVARQAMGLRGHLPRLARGLPII